MTQEQLVEVTKTVDGLKDEIIRNVHKSKKEDTLVILDELLSTIAQISTDIAVEQAMEAFVAQVKSAAEAGKAMQEKTDGKD